MATSPKDPRVLRAIEVAMHWMRSQEGKATARSVWAIAYPAWTNTGYAWCGGFQIAAFKQAGVDLNKCAWWAYTPNIKQFGVSKGFWKTSGQNFGDQALFDWNGDGVIDHVGASWPDPNSSLYRSVEGNTSRGTAGSQNMGGGAWVRYRSKPQLKGWVDIRKTLAWMIDTGKWDGVVRSIAPGAAPAPVNKYNPNGYSADYVRQVQSRLIVHGYDIGSSGVDGSLGPDTFAAVERFQAANGLVKDGLPGPLTMAKLNAAPVKTSTKPKKLVVDSYWGQATTYALQYINQMPVKDKIISNQPKVNKQSNLTTGWEWVSKATTGSALIRKMQTFLRRSGAYNDYVDGFAGPNFRRAMMVYYGGANFGAAVANMQRAINKQLGY